jgi:hypothetical protein
VVVVVVRLVYVVFVMFNVAVSVVHRSRVVSRRQVVGIRKDIIIGICCYVGWDRGIFCGTYSIVPAVYVFN